MLIKYREVGLFVKIYECVMRWMAMNMFANSACRTF